MSSQEQQPEPLLPRFAEDLAGQILQCVLHPNSTQQQAGFSNTRTSGGSTSSHPQTYSFSFSTEISAVAATTSTKYNYLDNFQLDLPKRMDYIYFGPGPAKLPRDVNFKYHTIQNDFNC